MKTPNPLQRRSVKEIIFKFYREDIFDGVSCGEILVNFLGFQLEVLFGEVYRRGLGQIVQNFINRPYNEVRFIR